MNNIYITGMMGCGKTTLGKELAKAAGRPFVDLDDEIVRRAGKSIPEIFAEEGEEAFRQRETEALRALSERENLIVACGGGTILREENVALMRETGRVLLNDRPLSRILSDITYDGRPVIAGGEEKLRRVYAERYTLYRKTCDVRLENTFRNAKTAARAAKQLLWPAL